MNKRLFPLRQIDALKKKLGPELSQPILLSAYAIITLLLLMALWALFAQLESASVAQGKIIVSSERKVIRHKEGGVIKAIYVKNGSIVKKGEVLLELDEIQADSQVDVLNQRVNLLLAMEARLLAERDNVNQINFPERLLKVKNDPDVRKAVSAQNLIFHTNRRSYEGQKAILGQKIKQLNQEIESYQSLIEAGETQLELVDEETQAVVELEKKKLVSKPRLLSLRRETARLRGERDKNSALIANAEQKIGEAKLQLILLDDERLKKVLDQLSSVQSDLSDALPRYEVARDVQVRTDILSPEDGTVFNLQYHTIGSYIQPGATVMEIVPSQDQLVIEAYVNPLDIDVVKPGLKANVILSAYKQRNMSQIHGKVTKVSADAVVNPNTEASYYIAHVEIPSEELSRVQNIKLYPGMPVEVMIVTGKQSPFEYFFRPIRESFNRAFRED